jgi:tRNA(Ile)-lysidine synthase
MLNPVLQSLEKSLKTLQVSRETRLLLGVSGGIDSMVMAHALRKLNHTITIAHVNFNFRGSESDGDAALVKNWCELNQVPFLLKDINTKQFAEEHNLNTQLAARKIRYDWWNELHESGEFDFVVTAHNLDDQIETFFINILRGTGMKGLQGIPSQRDFYIRPLLDVSRAEIEAYAKEVDVKFRIDSSNLSDDYHRNRIRHHLIPLLEDMSPGFNSRMKHNVSRIQKEWNALEKAYDDWLNKSVQEKNGSYSISYSDDQEAFLLRWLEENGIPWNLAYDFISSKNKHSGQLLQTDTHRLSRTERGYYFEKIVSAEKLIIPQPGVYLLDNAVFSIHPIDAKEVKWNEDPDEEYISGSVVQFPLQLRPVEPGDSFQPLGMQGKTKKIQDLLVDRKLEMHEKGKVMLLTNDHHILWVAGIQLDDRAKVKGEEEMVYLVTAKYR